MKVLDGNTPIADAKPSRVSFATSPDKTIDSTPPSSPEHPRNGTPDTDAARHEDGDAPRFDEHDDDFIRAKHRGSKPLSALRVNKILCRVPSHQSNISDLSASLSPSYVKTKSQPSADPVKKENPIYALLNACGVTGDISDLISSNPSLLGSEKASADKLDSPVLPEAKDKTPVDTPPVWGLAPSADGEESEEEEDVPPSIEPTNSELELIYDNVELVLDESALQRAPTPPQPGRRSPFAANGMLKKKVSGIIKSGRYSPKPQASPPAVVAIADSEARSATPTEDVSEGQVAAGKKRAGEDPNMAQKKDLASCDGIPRPSPVDGKVDGQNFMAATAAAVAAMKSSSRSSPRGSMVEKDAISRETKENVVDPNANLQTGTTVNENETKKTAKSSRVLKASSSEKPKSCTPESKSNKVKKERSRSLPSSPSRKFLRGLSSFKRGKSAAKINRNVVKSSAHVLEKKEIRLDSTSAPHNSESKKRILFKKKPAASLSTSTSPTTSNPTPTPAEIIEDAKYWKATLDKASSKTYYYHSKTKEVTWDKPPGFDEAQKIKENKLWKATVDANSGLTYYYHSKTKEVRWTKPEGYCERDKKKETEASGAGENVETEMNKGVVAEVNESKEQLSSLPVEKHTVDKVSPLSTVEKQAEDKTTPPSENILTDDSKQAEVQEPVIVEKAVDEQKAFETSPNVLNETAISAEMDGAKSEPHIVERINSIEDAPFDELTPATFKNKDGAQAMDEDTRGTMTNNQGQSTEFYKSIDFTSRTKTFASQMTDKTPKFNNTTSTIRTKDFTDTQIDVNMTSEAHEGAGNNINTPSIDSSLNSSAEDPPMITKQTTANDRDVPVDPKQNINVGNRKGSWQDESTVKDNIDDEESAVFDDWSDEVSDLSGIGNEKSGKKKLLIGKSGKKRDQQPSDSRSNSAQHQSTRNSRGKNFTQHELDNFIAKNDWGSVSKYIAEMRNNKPKVNKSQPTRREIQEAIESNQRIEGNGKGPRKRFGAKSQMQHDNVDEFSDMSPAESESLPKSMSTNSRDSSCSESGLTSFDDSPRRRRPHSRSNSRRRAT